MPRAGLTREKVVLGAADLADEVGLDRVTLAELAARLGVRQPSLYKHVDGLAAVRRDLAVAAKVELAGELRRAVTGRARTEALHALAAAYLAWARRRPGRYAAAQLAPAGDDAEDLEASEAAVSVVLDTLRGYGLDGDRGIDAVRTLRALVHGYADLERAGGFALPRDVDASLAWAVDVLDAALARARP